MKTRKLIVFLTVSVAIGCLCSCGLLRTDTTERPEVNFELLHLLYKGESFVCSPLSLQTAMALAAEGASGQTRSEILNRISSSVNEVASTETGPTLKQANAVVVNQNYPLLPTYRTSVETQYKATVDELNFSDPQFVANRINQWSKQQTEGSIRELLDPKDVTPATAAFLINALYFLGEWEGTAQRPMFLSDNTRTQDFYRADGSTCAVEMMSNKREHRYAELDGFRVLELPYAGGQYGFYVLLPDENNLPGLIDRLQTMTWTSILGQLQQDADVYVQLPKFELENKLDLAEVLMQMGIKKAFQPGVAQFDRMFVAKDGEEFCISKVIQGAKISVTEKGTEAGAVTIVQMMATTAFRPQERKQVHFYADHPFLFLLGDLHGNVLFQGAFVGGN